MGEVNLHDTFDAEVWTQEWLKTIKEHPSIPTDEGTMLGWFANAIMAGYDHARNQMKEEEAEWISSASEAIYMFAGWLTTREEAITISSRHNAGIVANLVREFCEANSLPEPRVMDGRNT